MLYRYINVTFISSFFIRNFRSSNTFTLMKGYAKRKFLLEANIKVKDSFTFVSTLSLFSEATLQTNLRVGGLLSAIYGNLCEQIAIRLLEVLVFQKVISYRGPEMADRVSP